MIAMIAASTLATVAGLMVRPPPCAPSSCPSSSPSWPASPTPATTPAESSTGDACTNDAIGDKDPNYPPCSCDYKCEGGSHQLTNN